MCGIFCYFNVGKQISKNIDDFKQEFYSIKHRGPDHSSIQFVDTNIIFGFHRLSINGLDSSGNQPMIINDKYFLICNGEIYNYKELAQKYNFKLKTNSDCEIILHLYIKFGIKKTVKLLNSESSFILYDKILKTIFFSRDHLGIRPLFIGYNNGEYYFASELKAIPNYVNSVTQYKPGMYGYISKFETNLYNSFYRIAQQEK